MTAPLAGAMASGRWPSPFDSFKTRAAKFPLTRENVRACLAYWKQRGNLVYIQECETLLRWLA